jgi:hypothetical protein
MFCAQCGVKGAGNFCTACGARLAASDAGPAVPFSPPAPPLPTGNWRDECRYEVLMQYPAVRDLVARHAAAARAGMTGEQFLDLCDKAFSPIPGVSMSAVAGIAMSIYAKLGVKTGQTRRAVQPTPVGQTIVSTVCSLARHGRSLKQVHQGDDGCVVEAVIPSDIWSFAGELVITIRRVPRGTLVQAATKIPGQLYDWGKSRKCLEQLFADVESIAA